MQESFISVNVVSSRGRTDCTANGVTSTKRNEKLFVKVLGGATKGDFTRADIEEHGGIILALEDRGSNIRDNFIPEGDGRWLMFGGNWVTGDSRFGNSYGPYPVPVHDRYEE